MNESRIKDGIQFFIRLAVAAGFLSAVADRMGFWPAEVSAWGNWQAFVEYTGYLNPWAPEAMVSMLAYVATLAEVVLALLLLIGFKTRWAAYGSAGLMLVFALSMTMTGGVKGPLDYSVFSAAAAALSLIFVNDYKWSLDHLMKA